jgi:hypothetical protein
MQWWVSRGFRWVMLACHERSALAPRAHDKAGTFHMTHVPCNRHPQRPQTVGRTAVSVRIVSGNQWPLRCPHGAPLAPCHTAVSRCHYFHSACVPRVRTTRLAHFPRPMYGITLWPPWAPQIVGRAAVSVPCFSQSVATPLPPWRAPRSLPHVTAHFLSFLSLRVRAPRAHDKVGTFSTTPVWDHALATQSGRPLPNGWAHRDFSSMFHSIRQWPRRRRCPHGVPLAPCHVGLQFFCHYFHSAWQRASCAHDKVGLVQ